MNKFEELKEAVSELLDTDGIICVLTGYLDIINTCDSNEELIDGIDEVISYLKNDVIVELSEIKKRAEEEER